MIAGVDFPIMSGWVLGLSLVAGIDGSLSSAFAWFAGAVAVATVVAGLVSLLRWRIAMGRARLRG